jgi:hypothetical protein
MTSAEILAAARDLYVSAPSHCAVEEVPEPGTYCMVTALNRTADYAPDSLYEPARIALAEVSTDAGFSSIVEANALLTTGAVVLLFDRAIQKVAA